METHVLAILGVIALVAAFIQGLSGFGFPLLAVPLFSFFLPMTTVVPITTILSVSVNVVMFGEIKNAKPRLRELLFLVGGSVFFIPLGVLCLKTMDTAWLKIFIGIVAIVCTFFLYRGLCLPIKRTTPWSIGVGALCGFLNGLANLAGPVLIMYLNNLRLEKKVFRAFTVVMFTTMGLVTITFATFNGLMTPNVLLAAAVMLPAIFFGSWLGARASKKVNDELFRKLSLVLLAATSLSILIGGLTSL